MSPLCPMTTRVRSTPSLRRTSCATSPVRCGALVCTVIGHARALVRLGHRTQHPLDAGCELLLDRALEERGADVGAGDALRDVPDEHVDHGFGAVEHGARADEAEEERQVVVGVEPGGRDDVDVHLLVDAGDAADVAAQPDDRRVDDGVDAALLEFLQAGDGVRNLLLLVPQGRVVLADLLVEHEDVLVHEHGAERTRGHRTSHRRDVHHGCAPQRCASAARAAARPMINCWIWLVPS